MKIVRIVAAVALLTTVAILSVSAQQRPAPGGTAPAAPTQSTGVVPDSKMAMIFSDAFMDPKTGIARFSALLTTLNREFSPRQTEINGMQTRINTLTKEIADTQAVAAPEAIRQKRDQLEQLNIDIKRKSEDGQTAYESRRREIFLPLQQDIGKALEAFAKARGITVIVDGSQVPVSYVAESLDITRAFINEFNSKNPATATVPQP